MANTYNGVVGMVDMFCTVSNYASGSYIMDDLTNNTDSIFDNAYINSMSDLPMIDSNRAMAVGFKTGEYTGVAVDSILGVVGAAKAVAGFSGVLRNVDEVGDVRYLNRLAEEGEEFSRTAQKYKLNTVPKVKAEIIERGQKGVRLDNFLTDDELRHLDKSTGLEWAQYDNKKGKWLKAGGIDENGGRYVDVDTDKFWPCPVKQDIKLSL